MTLIYIWIAVSIYNTFVIGINNHHPNALVIWALILGGPLTTPYILHKRDKTR